MSGAALPLTVAHLEEGIERRLHLGGQLYVSLAGETVADLAVGEARPGEAMTPDHLVLWMSSTKPLTAVAIARLWERGELELDDPVARHLPEFGARGKEGITVRHLLTHTGGLRMVGLGWPRRSWEEIVARIAAARPEPRWPPGERAGYHLESSWFVLGELVRRLSGRPFREAIRELVLLPLGMEESWIGMPAERWRAYGRRIAPLWNTEGWSGGAAPSHGWESEAAVTRPSPGGNGRGPIRELGRFYEALLAGGRGPRGRVLTPQTVEALTARHRVGMVDRTFRARIDWGLGFIVDSKHYREGEIPYGYGAHASPRTYGHSGYRSSTAFADPVQRLVVALAVNGTPGAEENRRRFHALASAVYEDLGLVAANNP